MMENYIVPIPKSKKAKDLSSMILKILYVAIVMILLYLPVIFIFLESVNANRSGYGFTKFTWKWYEEMWRDDDLHQAIITTFSITIISTALSTALGTLFAIGINSLAKKKSRTIVLLNNIPILNADIVSAVFLFIIFKTIGSFLGVRQPFGYFTLLLSHMFFSIPYVVLSVLPKLKEIDSNLFDAALDLGCKPRHALLKVVIPAIKGGIFSGLVLAFTMSIDDFTISYFVKGNEIQNLSTWINSIRTTKNGKLQIASAFYTIFTIVLFIGLIVYNIISDKKEKKRGKLV